MPDTVLVAFENTFDHGPDTQWTLNPNGSWCVDFQRENHKELFACYSQEGQLLDVEFEIHPDAAPEELWPCVRRAYPNAILSSVFERCQGNRTFYVVEIADGGQLFGLFFEGWDEFSIIPPDDIRFTSRMSIENN
ncbi:hypothetical protein Musp01_27890 [Muricauda sp. NBRC 101325]|nr:hypothetical protein Musp01_27890 [Muricauda sp. NBRC 101325]